MDFHITYIPDGKQEHISVNITPLLNAIVEAQQCGDVNVAQIVNDMYIDVDGKLQTINTKLNEIIIQNDLYHHQTQDRIINLDRKLMKEIDDIKNQQNRIENRQTLLIALTIIALATAITSIFAWIIN